MLVALRLIEPLHFFYETLDVAPTRTVLPFTAVAHAPDLVVHPYCATSFHPGRLAPFHASHQQIETFALFTDATVKILEGYAML